jgi:hypothetical protein
MKSLHVVFQPKDVDVILGCVGTYTFKDRSAVMEGMCIDWNLGVFPFHELAIKPDKLAAFFLHV